MKAKETEALLKFGIWSQRVGQRYSQIYLDKTKVVVDAIAWGTRREMLMLEKHLTERFGGMLNRESWANSRPPTLFPASEEAIGILKAAGLWP
jgi:hypothetical protein